MEKIIKICKNKVNFIFIKFSNLDSNDENYLNTIDLKINFSVKSLKNNNCKMIIMEEGNDNKQIESYFKLLLEKETIKFKAYFLVLRENINELFINVLKFSNLNSSIEYSKKNYNSLKEFISQKEVIKTLFLDSVINYNLCLKDDANSTIDFKYLKLLKIENFKELNVKLQNLLSLLSLFGCIKAIYYDYYNEIPYVYFSNKVEYSRIVENKKNLFYNNTKIKFSFEEINVDKLIMNEFQKIKYNLKINRFNKMVMAKYNAPNNVVHISNICSLYQNHRLYNLFRSISDPQWIKFLGKKKENTKMCIVKFKSIKESINFIINMNNKLIDRKKLKVSFSFNKIDI